MYIYIKLNAKMNYLTDVYYDSDCFFIKNLLFYYIASNLYSGPCRVKFYFSN